MSKSEFDVAAFYQALNSARAAKKLNWKQVAEASGVSASTLSRLAQGKRPDVDSLAGLLNWASLSADNFVGASVGSVRSPEPLSQITSVLYGDASLPPAGREAMIDMITAAYLRLRKTD
ncbi:MAG: helix-turn-helix domain-containing protein [Hyphomonadaceae bacterium]